MMMSIIERYMRVTKTLDNASHPSLRKGSKKQKHDKYHTYTTCLILPGKGPCKDNPFIPFPSGYMYTYAAFAFPLFNVDPAIPQWHEAVKESPSS
jgi:hypothetical protein